MPTDIIWYCPDCGEELSNEVFVPVHRCRKGHNQHAGGVDFVDLCKHQRQEIEELRAEVERLKSLNSTIAHDAAEAIADAALLRAELQAYKDDPAKALREVRDEPQDYEDDEDDEREWKACPVCEGRGRVNWLE